MLSNVFHGKVFAYYTVTHPSLSSTLVATVCSLCSWHIFTLDIYPSSLPLPPRENCSAHARLQEDLSRFAGTQRLCGFLKPACGHWMVALCLVCMTPQLARWYQQGTGTVTPAAACWRGDSRVPQTQSGREFKPWNLFFQKGDALIWYPGKWICPAPGNKECANPDASNFWQVAFWVPPSFSSNIHRRSLYGTTKTKEGTAQKLSI